MKISSRLRRWVRDYHDALAEFTLAQNNSDRAAEDAAVGRIDALFDSIPPRDLPSVVNALDDVHTSAEFDLLKRVANLRDPGSIRVLRTHFDAIPQSENDEALLGLRDQLRQIWPGGPATYVRRQAVLEEWFGGRASLTDENKWDVLWPFGMIRPHPNFFRGILAWAFCRHWPRLAKCHNPDCDAPYFVARRRDQKYCSESDECARFAGRAASRKYARKQEQARKGKRK